MIHLEELMSFQLIDSSVSLDYLEPFCRAAENDPSPAAQNMVILDWEKSPGSFLYKLYVDKIYDKENKGGYLLQIKDGQIISGSGFSKWNVDENVCLLYSRTYVLAEHRNNGAQRVGRYSWEQLKYMRAYQYKAGMITFNEYNARIVELLNGYNSAERTHTVVNGEYYNRHGRKFVPSITYPKKVNINHTDQIVVYYCDDASYKETLLNTLKKHEID